MPDDPSNEAPDAADYDTLEVTYEHLDAFTSILQLQTVALSRPPSMEEQVAGERGAPIRFDAGGRPSAWSRTVIAPDGKPETEITFVYRTPPPSRRRGRT